MIVTNLDQFLIKEHYVTIVAQCDMSRRFRFKYYQGTVGFYLTVPLSVAIFVNPQLASVTGKRPKLLNMVKEDLRCPAVDKD